MFISLSFATLKRGSVFMKNLLFFFCISLMMVSCSTDFDTIADYKETIVVYGLLNQYDSVQLIKVNKAFLGEGNALIMAQVADSIYYRDSLDVTMEKIDNGNVTATYTLQFDTSIPKDPGVFHNPYQVFYKLSGHPLNVNSEYLLRIKNRVTGVQVYSQSAVLGNCVIDEPDTIDKFSFTTPVYPTVQLYATPRAKVYNVTLRFHYTEVENGTGITTGKYFDWVFPDKVVDMSSTANVRYVVPGPDFYYLVGQNIPVDTHVVRHVGNPAVGNNLPMEIRVTAGSEDLERYMELNSPSSSIVQERPLYSNINNGVGLYTARLYYATYRDLTTASKLALDTSQYTKDLNFTP
jgi:hypothetical protein